MSARLSTALPRACSGDMYAAVPRIRPAAVLECASVGEREKSAELDAPELSPAQALARPKSSTLTLPSGASFTFAGLRSRWTMPFSCAASSASAICLPKAITSSLGIGPRFRRSASSSPSASSITSTCAACPSSGTLSKP